MISLGILTLHPQLESNYFTTIAKQSKKYNIIVFRFHPLQWDPGTNEVKGEMFDHFFHKWLQCTFPLPDFIYDRCYYTHKQNVNEFATVKMLKKETTFLSIGLPNKWSVYEVMKNHHILAPFLPKTEKITCVVDVINKLNHKKKLVLKPIRGAHGKGIFFLSKTTKDHIVIQTHVHGQKKTGMFSKKQFSHWLHNFNVTNNYIVQPFLRLTNFEGEPFDIRILVQKNETGDWQETGRGIRLGKKGNFVSNLHNGGKTKDFHEWIRDVPMNERNEVMKQLHIIVSTIPPFLDKQFGPLYEMGIDVGMDQTGKCWVLEVNSKPGYQTILKSLKNKDFYENPLRYCLYLHRFKSKGVTNDE